MAGLPWRYRIFGRQRRVPGSLRTLPRWVSAFPALCYAASALLEPFNAGMLCEDPWEVANLLLWPVNVALAAMLLGPSRNRRRLAGLFGTILSACALGLISFLHFLGPRWNMVGADTSSCGCFGPIPLPYPVHAMLLLGMGACLVLTFLHEETRLAEGAAIAQGSGPPAGTPSAPSP